MQLTTEHVFASRDMYEVKVRISKDDPWINFGPMSYTERKEMAEQLKAMAKELLKVRHA